MTRRPIATEIAGKWGLAGSTNLVLWGLLAVLIALFLGIAGGWWNGARLASGKAAKIQNKELKADLKATGALVDRQQSVIAGSSRKLQDAANRMTRIAEEATRERAENQRQLALIRNQLEGALAARPDLADVHVGSRVLDAWNAANRGRAAGAAGAAQPAAPVRPRADEAGAGKPARGKQ